MKKIKKVKYLWYGKRLNEMEAAPGFEPGNNGFADRCLSHLAMPPEKIKWSGRTDLNRRRLPWQGSTLPLSYARSSKRGVFIPKNRFLSIKI